tara:strand:+ start:299 stop:1636 length:1338 start_codon:yes stop_codon:yes gene_type:complete
MEYLIKSKFQILFFLIFSGSIFLFYRNFKKIFRNIKLGKGGVASNNKKERWKRVFFIAFGQSKMFDKPLVAFLHLIVYLGFIIINIEIVEIIIDGLFGTHRVLSFLGGFYDFLIGSFEVLAFLVLLSVIIFLIRRNIIRIRRFIHSEMKGWPTLDGNLILIFEILLMLAFLTMNAADSILQMNNYEKYIQAGAFPISNFFIVPLLENLNLDSLVIIERLCWWFHIIGILAFLNYLAISKHLHILLAFPSTYYSKLEPKGQFSNMDSITKEVKIMLDPNSDPFSQPAENESESFGAKDVKDLNWLQLLNAYSCTECGRCTSECPANITGKKLSPRKIMMDVRDRVEEVGKGIDKNGVNFNDEKSLLNDYIKPEELWACTSCNACVQACPINIDPLSIIMDLRRYAVMEESSAPSELNSVFSNIENNGAPWPFPASDRLNWKDDEKN